MPLTIQVLDVGQGDGIFIEFPNGKTMLVDLGSTKGKKFTGPDIITFFKNHTKFKDPNQVLDYLILTHGDRDHYNLIGNFLTALRPNITTLLYSGMADDYGSLIADLVNRNLLLFSQPINVCTGTGKLPFNLAPASDLGGVGVVVLAMNILKFDYGDDAWRKNSNSIVLQLNYLGVGVTLCGDATTDTELFIMRAFGEVLGLLRSTILKVGHHGSARTSVRPLWIQVVQPEYVFICADRHGSLSDDQATGHRLPQQLAIDIIRSNTKLATNCKPHTYVSSYNPADYEGYVTPDAQFLKDPSYPGFPNYKGPFPNAGYEKLGWGASWRTIPTTEGIFTTLAAMDVRAPNGVEYDQGAQYEIKIAENGRLVISATFDDTGAEEPLI